MYQTYRSVAQIAKYTLDSFELDDRLRVNLTLASVAVVLDRSTLSVLSRTFGLALFRRQPDKVYGLAFTPVGESTSTLAKQRELLIFPATLEQPDSGDHHPTSDTSNLRHFSLYTVIARK
jgi:hypothetical protein